MALRAGQGFDDAAYTKQRYLAVSVFAIGLLAIRPPILPIGVNHFFARSGLLAVLIVGLVPPRAGWPGAPTARSTSLSPAPTPSPIMGGKSASLLTVEGVGSATPTAAIPAA